MFDIYLADLKREMEKATKKVQSIADSFPVLHHTHPIYDVLVKAENMSHTYFKEVKRYEKYR